MRKKRCKAQESRGELSEAMYQAGQGRAEQSREQLRKVDEIEVKRSKAIQRKGDQGKAGQRRVGQGMRTQWRDVMTDMEGCEQDYIQIVI